MKPIRWSYSSLKQFEQCPRKYEARYILKNLPKDDSEQIRYGDRFHKEVQERVTKKKELPADLLFAEPIIEVFERIEGERLAEYKMGATIDLKPCVMFAKESWVNGTADLVILDQPNKRAYVVDWKTGKDKHPDKEQLILMSLLVFIHFPTVQHVKSALLFAVKDTMVTHTMYRKEMDKEWQKYRERVVDLEKAISCSTFMPKQNFTCRHYCGVKWCEFNGV